MSTPWHIGKAPQGHSRCRSSCDKKIQAKAKDSHFAFEHQISCLMGMILDLISARSCSSNAPDYHDVILHQDQAFVLPGSSPTTLRFGGRIWDIAGFSQITRLVDDLKICQLASTSFGYRNDMVHM